MEILIRLCENKSLAEAVSIQEILILLKDQTNKRLVDAYLEVVFNILAHNSAGIRDVIGFLNTAASLTKRRLLRLLKRFHRQTVQEFVKRGGLEALMEFKDDLEYLSCATECLELIFAHRIPLKWTPYQVFGYISGQLIPNLQKTKPDNAPIQPSRKPNNYLDLEQGVLPSDYLSRLNAMLGRAQGSIQEVKGTEAIKSRTSASDYMLYVVSGRSATRKRALRDMLRLTLFNPQNAVLLIKSDQWQERLQGMLGQLSQQPEYQAATDLHTQVLKETMKVKEQGWKYAIKLLQTEQPILVDLLTSFVFSLQQEKAEEQRLLWKNLLIMARLLQKSQRVDRQYPIRKKFCFQLFRVQQYTLKEHKTITKIGEQVASHNNSSRTQFEQKMIAAQARQEESRRQRGQVARRVLESLQHWRGPWCNVPPRVLRHSSKLSSELSQPLLTVQKVAERPIHQQQKQSTFSLQLDHLRTLPPTDRTVLSLPVQWVLPQTSRYGTLTLIASNQEPKLGFVYDVSKQSLFDPRAELFSYTHPADKPLTKLWSLLGLRQVICKSYLQQPRAVELLLNDGRPLLFHFARKSDHKKFAYKLRQCSGTVPSRVTCDSPSPIMSQLTKRWHEWKISNFQYLMELNLRAGRSLQDLTQYPIFPWVIADYSSLQRRKPSWYRKLSQQMGQQADNPLEPGIILNYLIRMYPYSEGAKKLQGGHFDQPDCIFQCIPSAFANYQSELIPQFFVNPQFLINYAEIDFGVTETNELVHNVRLPEWARDAYEFVRIHRQALESDNVSENLHRWIDLNFGSPQQGEDTAHNSGCGPSFDQVFQMGAKPTQLFKTPHTRRQMRSSVFLEPNVLCKDAEISVHRLKLNDVGDQPILKLRLTEDNHLHVLQSGSWVKLQLRIPLAKGAATPLNFLHKSSNKFSPEVPVLEQTDRSVRTPMEMVAKGGFWDGSIEILRKGRRTAHESTVLCIAASKSLCVTGAKLGDVIVWDMDRDWAVKWHYYDHDGWVTCVGISAELNCFASGGRDGALNLYSLGSGGLLRVIRVGSPIGEMAFGMVPPAKMVAYCPEERKLVSYSLNGHFLCEAEEDGGSVVSLKVVKDPNFNEFLVYGTDSGNVTLRSTADLMVFSSFEVGAPVLSIDVHFQLMFIIVGHEKGEVSVLFDQNMPAALTLKRLEEL